IPNPTTGGTTVTWHANENGTFDVRVDGTTCSTGTSVDSGSYANQPTTHATIIAAGSLAEGANTIRVCVTDGVGNVGSTPVSVTKDSPPPITASVTSPANGSVLRAATVPANFSGSAADNSGGSGLNANNTTFTLKRGSDNMYWNGSTWQAGPFGLTTTHSAT